MRKKKWEIFVVVWASDDPALDEAADGMRAFVTDLHGVRLCGRRQLSAPGPISTTSRPLAGSGVAASA